VFLAECDLGSAGLSKRQKEKSLHSRRRKKNMKIKNAILIPVCFVFVCTLPLPAQQKGQWVPGQFGLNAGVIPDPEITYANLAVNYSAGQLNDSAGNKRSGITGTYSFWADENILYYVPNHKILGGYFMPHISLNVANGSLVADIAGTNLSANGGGGGFADLVPPCSDNDLGNDGTRRPQPNLADSLD
jgi:hypothetical protein